MKLIASIVSLAIAISSFAQADTSGRPIRHKQNLAEFQYALKYDDLVTAAQALTAYLVDGGSTTYRDTLALVYYRMGNLTGAYRLSKELFDADAKNSTALTMLADISARAGETKTSIEWYEKLVVLEPNPYNFYQLATRQFMLERLAECKQSLEKVIADSAKAKEYAVAMEIANGQSEQVPVLAAAYNMLGVIAYKEKNTAEARRNYNLAIKAFPQFVIAAQNLEGLNAPKPAPGTKSATPTKPKS